MDGDNWKLIYLSKQGVEYGSNIDLQWKALGPWG